ncbi:unnamed protein product [Meloidogyne enterolobii]|uniref:Uncharacterized protein n=1 Tax=Meloidogyne enterolobii TaxID=390850 RepID=A0ACB0YK98_MELEN
MSRAIISDHLSTSTWARPAASLSWTASASKRSFSSTVVSVAFSAVRTARPFTLSVAKTVASCNRMNADIVTAVVQLNSQRVVVVVVAVVQLNQKRNG